MSDSEIFDKYGADGITEYELRHGVAEISDYLAFRFSKPYVHVPVCDGGM